MNQVKKKKQEEKEEEETSILPFCRIFYLENIDEVVCFGRCSDSDSDSGWEFLEQRRDVFLSLSSLFSQCWFPPLKFLIL